ncbi:MAG: DUF4262 domain-containing protein [Erythrobacter sp.]|uniref:DUF4262 domain-containing protein n=1 Tax=Erythrobacter sp. TaxID=1042 RepID=UPI0025E0E0C5|nr:DUF4262 domain-containing protein [Erythrobacter sp.]MCL9998652.1 DUF4262 domain-containing protein [Erythrobacter sp.]
MKNWFKRDGLTAYERDIVENIEKHGCHITGVFDPDGDAPSFAYSVGFTRTLEKTGNPDYPEVIMFGLPREVVGPAINSLLAMCAAGQPLVEGERLEAFFGEYDAVVRLVHETQIVENYLNSAMWYHRTQMGRPLRDVAMIVWPDATGLYPWEEGCEAWVQSDQPALYEPRLDS